MTHSVVVVNSARAEGYCSVCGPITLGAIGACPGMNGAIREGYRYIAPAPKRYEDIPVRQVPWKRFGRLQPKVGTNGV